MANQTINVNYTPGLFQPTLYYSQDDVGRVFQINLEGFEIPSGATVTIQATKPSGLGFTVAADSVDGNVATFTTTSVMTDESGRFPAELHIVSGNIEVGTANFLMVGERNPHPSGTTDGSQGTIIPELTLLVERVEAAADSIHNLSVTATTLPAGSDATASFDDETDTLSLGIPRGADGDVTREEFNDLKSEFNRLVTESDNLFNPLTVKDGYYIGSNGAETANANSHTSDYIPVEEGSVYFIKLTYVAGMYYYLATYDSNKVFKNRLNAYQLPSTIKIDDGVSYVRVSFYNMAVPSDFMFAKGISVPQKFTPHYLISNDVIPEVVDKINAVVEKSPNLFDISTITTGKYQNASGSLVNEASSAISDYIPVEGGATYIPTQLSNIYYYFGTYDSEGTFINRINAYQTSTVTLGNDVAYIRISMYQASFPNDYMLVKGSDLPSQFKPYGYMLKETAVNDANNKVVISKTSASALSIQTGKGKHILTHQTYTSKNLDTWRLTQGYGNGNLLWNDVDVECPIKEKDASDFMGGYHGDEIMTDVVMLADGNAFDISDYSIGDVVECDNFTICVISDIYYDGDSVNKAFIRYKRLVFEDGKLQIYNTYKFVGTTIQIDIATGCGLYPVSSNYINGYSTNTGNAYISEATTNRNRYLDRVSFYGDDFTINLKVLFGKGDAYYGVVYYYPDQTRYKVYFYQHYTVGSNYLTLNNGDELYSGYEIAFV